MSHRRAKKIRQILKQNFESYTKKFYRFCKRNVENVPGYKDYVNPKHADKTIEAFFSKSKRS